jgi:glycosyltransferase involved in cell wall biosynthesis
VAQIMRGIVRQAQTDKRPHKLALVLWNGQVGGAQVMTVALAQHMLRLGANITIVFIGTPWPLAERLVSRAIPFRTLGLGRGRDVLRCARQYAAEINRTGPDGALLVERGMMGAALRVGGYRGPIVAVEHGALPLEQRDPSNTRRLLKHLSRFVGAHAVDADVAVSDFMLEQMHRSAHAKRTERIYNGIDPDASQPRVSTLAERQRELTVGFAGRLVSGKGADHLITSIGEASRQLPVRLLVAGDGPERKRLEVLASELESDSYIDFLGFVGKMSAFWQCCDIAAIPSDMIESFSMVTLEAMAWGKPVVAARIGGIPELVVNGVTGILVPPGDPSALARAFVTYAERRELCHTHGTAARVRAIERFHIEDCAQAYLDLFDELAASLQRSAGWHP